MEEVRRLIIDRNDDRVKSQFSYHQGFADTCNEIIEKVNEEYPDLYSKFDADFLWKMITGKVKTEYQGHGLHRYKRLMDEAEVTATFSDTTKGLKMKLEQAIKMFALPPFSKELEQLFGRIHHQKESIGLDLSFLEVRGNKIVFTEKAKTIIRRNNSTELIGEEVEAWEEAEAIAERLNAFVEKYHGGRAHLSRLIGIDNRTDKYRPLKTAIPRNMDAAKGAAVAQQSMAGAPEIGNGIANPDVAEMLYFDQGSIRGPKQ